MYTYDHSGDDDRLLSLGLSVRAYNYCLRNGIKTVSELIDYFHSNGDSIPPGINAGKTTITELSFVCKTLLSTSDLKFNNDSAEAGIKSWGLSTRAYNCCQASRLTTKADLVGYYLSNNRSIPPQPNAGKKTIDELSELCVRLLREEPSLAYGFDIHDGNNLINYINKAFNLSDEDSSFLALFHENHSHIPILWLISKLIDSNNDIFCFAYAYGIDQSRGQKSVADLAKQFQVTVARAGQRVVNGYSELFNISDPQQRVKINKCELSRVFCTENTRYLEEYISDSDVICSDDPISKVEDLNISENTSFSCSFILKLISSLSDNFMCLGDFERNRQDTDIILVNKEISRVFDFAQFIKEFYHLIEGLVECSTINIREYVEDSPCWIEYSSRNVDRVLKACKQIILSRHEIFDENGDDIYIIYPQKIDIGAVAYSIISAAGYPITLTEIISEAAKQYPTNSFSEETIRIAIKEDDRIQYKRDGGGKTKYLLANADIPSSVRDAIVRVLENSATPVKLDDIVDFVMLHFPSSSKNSVRTTMLNDGRSRFVQFADSRFGLSSKEYSSDFEVLSDTSRASYEERIIMLKNFLHENSDFPSVYSENSEEVSLARWVDRNTNRQELSELISTYRPIIWEAQCKLCEQYIISHSGRLPSKERSPKLFAWLMKAAEDFNDGLLSQSQKKLYLHLKMVIVNSHA